MKLLVIGAGMMGSAAAYDMARAGDVESVTLADADGKLAESAAARVNKLNGNKKVRAVRLDAANYKAAGKLMRGHAAVLSAVPYFFNVGLAKAAIEAKCHFADLGGNNTVVRKTYAMSKQAAKRGVALAPDCGLSPGMASILAGELFRRMAGNNGKVDALKLYVGGLPEDPQPPFFYHLVFSVNGLINEFVEPAKVLRNGKITEIEPLTEAEDFQMGGFDPMVAFHTSGGTSTMPETFKGRVGECFEKTLRYPSHFAMIRSLYDLGYFSSEKMKLGKTEVTPREVTSQIFLNKLTSDAPDVCIMRIEAHTDGHVAAFNMVDHYDEKAKMTAMMRTTAWPASIVVLMMARGTIKKRGGIMQETDVPANDFLNEMSKRGIRIDYALR
ncbi:MAG: Saccharopine dehydrogenase [Acidobacteriales bacterium]|nr:Saccharopine dehydrogenase [Terriglobales bacterium]